MSIDDVIVATEVQIIEVFWHQMKIITTKNMEGREFISGHLQSAIYYSPLSNGFCYYVQDVIGNYEY